MCCCGKPTINGELGYRWNNPDAAPGSYPVNPPALQDGDELLYDEPGRCGRSTDSHCHHFRIVKWYSSAFLLVRHGGGDQRYRLHQQEILLDLLASMDSEQRYWLLAMLYYTMNDAATDARHSEHSRWVHAIAEKRVKVSTRKGVKRVTIEPKIMPLLEVQ